MEYEFPAAVIRETLLQCLKVCDAYERQKSFNATRGLASSCLQQRGYWAVPLLLQVTVFCSLRTALKKLFHTHTPVCSNYQHSLPLNTRTNSVTFLDTVFKISQRWQFRQNISTASVNSDHVCFSFSASGLAHFVKFKEPSQSCCLRAKGWRLGHDEGKLAFYSLHWIYSIASLMLITRLTERNNIYYIYIWSFRLLWGHFLIFLSVSHHSLRIASLT